MAAVLLFHGDRLRGGFLGVDLFFVLSGYLITALLLVEDRDRGRVDLGQFWLRRARRLLPAACALVVVVAAFNRFVADPGQWTAIRGDGLATLGYVANWHTIFAGGAYGADLVARSPLEHTWSLAIEEQFYLVWPLVVVGLLALRRSPRTIVLAAGAVVATSTIALVGGSLAGISQNTLYLGTHTRMASIGFGALVAAWEAGRTEHRSPRLGRTLEVVAPTAFLLLLVAWCTVGLHDQLLYRGGLTACGLAAAVVIWSVVQPGGGPLDRVLSVRPLRALGLISYGLYLWHWPLFVLLDEDRTGLHGWVLFTVRAVASLTVAWVSYHLLEQPIRRSSWGGAKVARRSVVAIGLAAVALVASAVGAPPNVFASAGSGPTFTRAAGQAPVLALYGDSVAYLLGLEGLAPRADALHVSVVDAARLGCEPLGGVTAARDGLGEPVWDKAWIDCIDTLPTYRSGLSQRPDVAVIFFGGVQWDARIAGSWRHPCDAAYRDLYRSRMVLAIRRAGAGGIPVVVVKGPPVISDRISRLKGMDDGARRNGCLWQSLAPELPQLGARVVDLDAHLCSSETSCDATGADASNRADGIHFRGAAARDLATWLVPEILRVVRR
ncbi:MAG: putative acyltransferase [Acidimicrobiales bacterium]|nr:putative acyltransferase [Acidimicrobiales bacterium]